MAAGAGGLGQPASLLTRWADCPPISPRSCEEGLLIREPPFSLIAFHLNRDLGVEGWGKGTEPNALGHMFSLSQRGAKAGVR